LEQLQRHNGTVSAGARFKREQYFSEEWNPQIAEFLSLFHRYDYICKPLSGGSWFSANEQWKLTDTEILKAVAGAHSKYILGCRAGKASRFAVIDIDAGSKYHNAKQLHKLLSALSEAGISRTSIYRSSDSDGWHVYIFFDEPVSSRDLQRTLFSLFSLNGFEIAKGKLEIFPNPGDKSSKGQGLRLPLQQGFAWLNSKTLDVVHERWEVSPEKAIDFFLDDLEHGANTRHDFHKMKGHVERLLERRDAIIVSVQAPTKSAQVIPLRRRTTNEDTSSTAAELVVENFGHWPNGMKPDVWLKGREYFEQGLTAPGQRADAIYSLSHYLFYGDPHLDRPALGYGYEQERQWAIERILLSKHNGQSKDIDAGRGDALTQVERAAHWVPQHKRGQETQRYESKVPIAWIRNNANRKLNARKRITEAVEAFVRLKKQFSIRDLMEQSGCSQSALYNNQDLWRAKQEQLRTNDFAAVSHEYNAGVGAAVSKQQPLLPSVSEKMPPGRLAARQIVSEISMRIKRDIRKKERESYAITEGAQEKWQMIFFELKKADIGSLSERDLRTRLALLGSFMDTAPDEDSEIEIKRILENSKDELVRRLRGPLGQPYT
jgi:hypothetical protein